MRKLKNKRDIAACGIGVSKPLADSEVEGLPEPSFKNLQAALYRLSCMDSRGGYNPMTGASDGAGIRTDMPVEFFNHELKKSYEEGDFGVGQFFLPHKKEDLNECQALIERKLEDQGLRVVAWREVPFDGSKCKSKPALKKMPKMMQAIYEPVDGNQKDIEQASLEAALEINNAAIDDKLDMNVVSLSSENIIYKGMVRAAEVGEFFTDLTSPNYKTRDTQIHVRFSTNTEPEWSNAQPCPYFIAHNGELNSRKKGYLERKVKNSEDESAHRVVMEAHKSDSIQFDIDLAGEIADGKDIAQALVELMPPNLEGEDYSDDVKDMIEYFRINRTGYNGPAHVVATHKGDTYVKLDSNGLRPSRYVVVQDQNGKRYFHAYSEDNISFGENIITEVSGSLRPGEIIKISKDGEITHNDEILEELAKRADYKRLLDEKLDELEDSEELDGQRDVQVIHGDKDHIITQRQAFWDQDAIDFMIKPMCGLGADNKLIPAKQRVYAMGDDTAMSPLSGFPLHISSFFKQKFSQVSSPPLDSINERESFNMSTYIGAQGNGRGKIIKVKSPILKAGGLEDLAKAANKAGSKMVKLAMGFAPARDKDGQYDLDDSDSLKKSLDALCKEVARQVEGGASIIVLSDMVLEGEQVPIPDILAVKAVDKYLKDKGLRSQASIVAESAQVNSPHQTACLLAFGASAVSPSMAYEEIARLRKTLPGVVNYKLKDLQANYHKAMDDSLRKTMGKYGISDVNNYIGGELMEVLGLNLSTDPYLADLFDDLYSPIDGFDFDDIAWNSLIRANVAKNTDVQDGLLDLGKYCDRGEEALGHGYGPNFTKIFSKFLDGARGINPRQKDENGFYTRKYKNQFEMSVAYREYTRTVEDLREKTPVSLYDFMTPNWSQADPISNPKDVQSVSKILKTFHAGQMSLGALVPDAHQTLTRGMNAIGANSAAGEGGEKYKHLRNKLKSAKNKQIASGRFGISPEMLASIKGNGGMIEIKMAQGAKPGEGGQLPDGKVSVEIAALRGSLPGTGLISPPPHHDIYSIEDLKELIYDLKCAGIKVGVKLVASEGIGTIACGVVKAGADEINIAGNSGGTGAAQVTSIKDSGMPPEIGLSEVDIALREAGIRDLVKLKTSGAFKNGWDIVKAAILGADDFELGTTALFTVGCKMLRMCNKPGGCAPGVTNTKENFKGKQEDVEEYMMNLAAEVQEILADLGYHSLESIKGHTELLEMGRIPDDIREKFDFDDVIGKRPDNPHIPQSVIDDHHAMKRRKGHDIIDLNKSVIQSGSQKIVVNSLDKAARKADSDFDQDKAISLNTDDRAFGGAIAVAACEYFARKRDKKYLTDKQRIVEEDYLEIRTKGTPGQKYGFVNAHGVFLNHVGSVQDGLGESMAGGVIAVRTSEKNVRLKENADQNIIAGNAAFYGAYGGKAFVNGKAGDRFAIENHGANIVVEGIGNYGCEFMTSGTVLNIGDCGKHFGTGMKGGIVMQYDDKGKLDRKISENDVRLASDLEAKKYHDAIRKMLEEHHARTGSVKAAGILENWEQEKGNFKVCIPHALDKVQTKEQRDALEKAFKQRRAPISEGMRVWREENDRGKVVYDDEEGSYWSVSDSEASVSGEEGRSGGLSW